MKVDPVITIISDASASMEIQLPNNSPRYNTVMFIEYGLAAFHMGKDRYMWLANIVL